MKTCPSCNTSNPDSALYCGNCAKPLQQQRAARTCQRGHPMDPSWTECDYCKSDAASGSSTGSMRRETVLEGVSLPPAGPAPNGPRLPTVVDPAAQMRPKSPRPFEDPQLSNMGRPGAVAPKTPTPQGERKRDVTVFRPSPAATPAVNVSSGPVPTISKRKIVVVLVSYTWHPDGKMYPVYEERNLIGRGPHCEIHVPEDDSMSSENSHITTHRQKFVVGDKVSMMGTYLDGERILEAFHPLSNYAVIRAGSTDFTFIMVQPPAPQPPSSREG